MLSALAKLTAESESSETVPWEMSFFFSSCLCRSLSWQASVCMPCALVALRILIATSQFIVHGVAVTGEPNVTMCGHARRILNKFKRIMLSCLGG